MTAETRFERSLPGILEDLYLGPTPDYRDEVVAAAVRTRQRPAWTFPGRWFPMLDIAVRPVAAPRLPLRVLGVALLLIALLVAALAYVGSQQRTRLPFGPARNGLITWAFDGDIYVGDPASGDIRAAIPAPDIDRNPTFSRDGTHLAFLRQVPDHTGDFDLVVTQADGSSPLVVSAVPLKMPSEVVWAPDGKSLLVNDEDTRMVRYFLDGSTSQLLLEGVGFDPQPFQPPDGGRIFYERTSDPGSLYMMSADGSGARRIFGSQASCACSRVGPAAWSPDGRLIALPLSTDGETGRLFLMNADGTGLHQLTDEAGKWFESEPAWSPDGTQIAFNRWQADDTGDYEVRPIGIVPVSGGQVRSVGVGPSSGGALIEWAPDGKSILSLPDTVREGFKWSQGAPGTIARPTIIDLTDGSTRQLDWSVGSISSWQRLP